MGRAPCCDKANVKRGPWSPEEDAKLKEYIDKHGTGGNWIALPQKAGLRRCGKSCRLRWLNYLRPNIKHGEFSDDEDRIICTLFASIGSRWSVIAAQLPGRTDNDIKNYWNTKLKKKLMGTMVNNNSSPATSHHPRKPLHQPITFSSFLHQAPSPSSYYNTTTPAAAAAGLDLESMSLSSPTNYFMTKLPQESLIGSPMQNYHSVLKDSNSNLLMFGGGDHQVSSSCSSDGSQIDQHYNNYNFYNNGGGQNQKLVPIGSGMSMWGSSETTSTTITHDHHPLDYGLEEIKQLISSTNSCNNFLLDENKTAAAAAEERVLYY